MAEPVVLLVDDDPLNLDILVEALEGQGFQLETAQDGQRAWEMMLASPSRYSAIVLDRMMPRLDGLALLKIINSHPILRNIPVILQTAAALNHQILEGLQAGAYYYLTKPYDFRVAHYRTAAACAEAIAAIMAQAWVPAALEFLDKGALGLIRSRQPDLVSATTEALLMIEVDGSDADIAAAQQAISAAARHDGLLHLETMREPERLWAARKALSPLLKDIAPKKINEDVVVPVSRLPQLLAGIEEICSRHRIRNVNFGHAGNGNIHVNLLVNPDDDEEMQRAEPCLSEIFDLVLALNGTLSGEHGVGQEKRPYVDRELSTASLGLMRGIKQVFDPAGILNPGKVLPA